MSTDPAKPPSPTIWVDADGAPGAVKEIIFKASQRTRVPVKVVANRWQQTPKFRWIQAVVVDGGLDVADDYIAEQCQPGDLVITSDVPLAARVIESGASVIRFRGEVLTQTNVQQRLQVRDFLDDLRGSGIQTGGPPPYGQKDKQQFANALDKWLATRR